MAYTISFQSKGKANQAHNRRDASAVERANQRDVDAGLSPHIDAQGNYSNWVDKTPMQALHEALDGVVDAYNAKQKRKDRRTTLERVVDKYTKLIAGKKADLVREVVIEIGNKDNHPSDNECMAYYRFALKKFRKENPNLIIIGAYYHNDEPTAGPHMHIDYIPTHKKRTRGLDVQLGMAGALEDLGYSNDAGFSTAQAREVGAMAAWDNHMHDMLHELAHDMGYDTVRGTSKGRQHEDSREYKQREKILELERANAAKDRQIAERAAKDRQINPFSRGFGSFERKPIDWGRDDAIIM